MAAGYTALNLTLWALVAIVTITAVAMFAAGVERMLETFRLGSSSARRTDRPLARFENTVTEVVFHTRMLRWSVPGVAHWWVTLGFVTLVSTLVTAYGQVLDPRWTVPFGRTYGYAIFVEAMATLTLVAIVALILVRAHKRLTAPGRASRFFGSSAWQAAFVELTIVVISVLILLLRAGEYALDAARGSASADRLHHPVSYDLGEWLTQFSVADVEVYVVTLATIKILVSMAWFGVVGMTTTMGVAWHRFLAPFNILLKRDPTGGTSLGALPAMRVDGKDLSLDDLEELDVDSSLGAGTVTDFSWKALLDFSTCTECGRCQSQCPAWNTEKPLSPKLLITTLRSHAAETVDGLFTGPFGGPVDSLPIGAPERSASTTPLVGPTPGGYGSGQGLTATSDHANLDALALASEGVIDPDVLWSCTTCGACVEQCPVDIEHVDHIVEMRRHQVLMESAFPTELGGLFRNLENKANPWGMRQSTRLDWAKDLPFEVSVVGAGDGEVADLRAVDYLMWVGCAGAFDDRAKATTRALAELLYIAGVSFAVLGDGESCTGDPARRAGNEFLFQQLAQANAETLREAQAAHVVTTCAHCFNTLSNEYGALGVKLEVVHHTQLLNRLVRMGRLVPVAPADRATAGVTYHDPCYLGRHNGVYTPPRELLGAAGLRLREMPRHGERSFCCGAGGARLWMEESIGTRINASRTDEAAATGAPTLATACPFCRIMLTDGAAARASADDEGPDCGWGGAHGGHRRGPAAPGLGQAGNPPRERRVLRRLEGRCGYGLIASRVGAVRPLRRGAPAPADGNPGTGRPRRREPREGPPGSRSVRRRPGHAGTTPSGGRRCPRGGRGRRVRDRS